MSHIYNAGRNIDIVFCIDGTGSMEPIICNVKFFIKNFYTKLVDSLREDFSNTNKLRVKIIVFRDYETEQQAIVESEFYDISTEEDKLLTYLDGIRAYGGGDDSENGLEALYYAMRSDFTAVEAKDRQIIILLSNADALDLKERARLPNYPKDMVDNEGLLRTWMGDPGCQTKLRERCKRLILVAPENTKYCELHRYYNRSMFKRLSDASEIADPNFVDDLIRMWWG